MDQIGERNNPECEENISKLLKTWQQLDLPIIYVRHDSKSPTSKLRPGQSGNDFKDILTPTPDLLVTKSVNSAFIGSPDLNSWLKGEGITEVAICGIQTNMCCETTARMAGNLGYNTWFLLDATHTFAKTVAGTKYSAETLAEITAVNLSGEFAEVISTEEAITRINQ